MGMYGLASVLALASEEASAGGVLSRAKLWSLSSTNLAMTMQWNETNQNLLWPKKITNHTAEVMGMEEKRLDLSG